MTHEERAGLLIKELHRDVDDAFDPEGTMAGTLTMYMAAAFEAVAAEARRDAIEECADIAHVATDDIEGTIRALLRDGDE